MARGLPQTNSEGLELRQQHDKRIMESRNTTLTTCGECASISPQDRKAVNTLEDLLGQVEAPTSICFPLYNLIPEIISDENMERSFKRVMSNLHNADTRSGIKWRETVVIDGVECTPRMVRYMRRKKEIIAELKEQIGNGTFRVVRLSSFEVDDGPKRRMVQAPPVVKRIGCNAIMEIVEKHLSPLLIENTAASIEGRGPHGLFHKMQEVRAENPDLIYYYQSDYKGYYDHILHDKMIDIIKQYIADPILLPILIDFVKVLHPDGNVGISKGLRSSQFFGNLYHNDIDHAMIEECGKDNYNRFCDDIYIYGDNKKELWKHRDTLHRLSKPYNLIIKTSEKVAPVSAGMDALGYIDYGDHSRIRKRTKVNAARKLAKIKSRKRRQQIIGSFKGMACHADCKHLYYILTGKRMKKFSEMGVTYTPADGKKRFPGKVTRLGDIVNITIEIHDYETLDTKFGEDRYLVSFKNPVTQEWGKFFTASDEMKGILDQISDIEDGFPFETVIKCEQFDGNKRKYNFT